MKFTRLIIAALLLMVMPAYAEIPVTSFYKEEPRHSQQARKIFVYEEAIDGDTFRSSLALINLWGIEAPSDAIYAAVSKMYLDIILKQGQISCKLMELQNAAYHCLIDGLDVGSMIIQMGMARAADAYYEREQEIAQQEGRGVWKKAEDLQE